MDTQPRQRTLDSRPSDTLKPALEPEVPALSDRPGSPAAGRQHNSALAIHSLPAEIFLECLFLSIDFISINRPFIPQLHALAQVCAYWMYSIRSHARFWRLINLEERSWVDMVLKKNQNGPLVVRCLSSEYEEPLDFLKIACELAPRLKGITMHSELGSGGTELVEAHLPLLIRLEITNYDQSDADDAVLLSAPALEHLDISHIYLHWDSPSLAGLKYLQIADLEYGIPSLVEFLTILRASPQLEWLGLQRLYPPRSASHTEEIVPAKFRGAVTLIALRGLDFESSFDPITQYLIGRINVPNCQLISVEIPYEEILRPGSTSRQLAKIPMQLDGTSITITHWDAITSINTNSQLEHQNLAGWVLDPNHSGGFVRVPDVPYGEEQWTRVIDAIGLPLNRSTCALDLLLGYGPAIFSGDDIAFWSSVSSITFVSHQYPHTLSALQYLSNPSTNRNGEAQWPCPRLDSISIPPEKFEEDWSTEAGLDLVAGIVKLLGNRMAASVQRESADYGVKKLLPTAFKSIWGPGLLIEGLRGKVSEGVRLYKSDE